MYDIFSEDKCNERKWNRVRRRILRELLYIGWFRRFFWLGDILNKGLKEVRELDIRILEDRVF